MRDLLPTSSNLIKKGEVDNYCVNCGVEVENDVHVFMTCLVAKAVWWCCLGLQIQDLALSSFLNIFLEASSLLSEDDLEIFVTTAWFLWSNTNNSLWNHLHRDPGVIVEQQKLWLEKFRLVRERSPKARQGEIPAALWVPLELGVFKMNVDGAVFKETNCLGMEVWVIIRDNY